MLMLYYGISWSLNLFMFPLLVACVIFTAVGVGTFLAALLVAYRDVRYIMPFIVQLWLFATPVVYPASLVPEKWRWLLYLNPMAGIIEGFRSGFLDRPFDFVALSISVFVAVLVFMFGVAYFEKVERRFADII
jgi:lipopolysaccharide transport system permease protein